MATDQHGIPLFLQTASGNEPDKKTLLTIITQLAKYLQCPGRVCHIADAAFYTTENLATLSTHTFWISRVPATLNEVQDLVATDLPLQPCADDRYQYAEHASAYAGISQKWVVYHSAPMQEQQEKTFEKRLENDKKKAETPLRKLGAREFACESDARIAAGSGCRSTRSSASPHLRSGRSPGRRQRNAADRRQMAGGDGLYGRCRD